MAVRGLLKILPRTTFCRVLTVFGSEIPHYARHQKVTGYFKPTHIEKNNDHIAINIFDRCKLFRTDRQQ